MIERSGRTSGLVHGGDVYSPRDTYQGEWTDFSANISPLGMPQAVREALVGNLDAYACYPDPLCRELCGALSIFHNVPEEKILCGNGAADLIFRLAYGLRPRQALVPAPTFAEYALALEAAGCEYRYVHLRAEDGFFVGEALWQAVTPSYDLVFLCNPNNPTGRALPRADVLRLAQRCAECGARLVVDECFADFLDEEGAYSVIGDLDAYPNLIVLRAFTKMYAMAGIRLGYLLTSDTSVLDRLRSAGQPWAVSTVASKCGVAALGCTQHVAATRETVRQGRRYLSQEMEKIGLTVYPSQANFLLFRCSDAALPQKLERRGFLIRSCANYPGLDSSYFRIAVRTMPDNQRLLQALAEILS